MATPQRDKRTGKYRFRKAVPKRLVGKIGKTEIIRSLDTTDHAEAKIRFLAVAAEVEAEWAALAVEQPKLTLDQIRGLAREFYEWKVAKHKDDPGKAERWLAELDSFHKRSERSWDGRPRHPAANVAAFLPDLKAFCQERNITIPEASWLPFLSKAMKAGNHAKGTLVNHTEDDLSYDPMIASWPRWEPPPAEAPTGKAPRLTLKDHFDRYVRETGISPKTRKSWRSKLTKLAEHIGSDNLATATPDHIVAWKTALLDLGLSHKTIREGYLAAATSFFNWAIGSLIVAVNPVKGVTLRLPQKVQLREASFTDEEAALILTETLRPPDDRASRELADARRWVPWIMAYSGARVNEITQLRGQDVFSRKIGNEEVWVIRITPDAGPVKTGEARDFPIHPHIVEQGFIEFVKRKGSGPLFYEPGRRRNGSDENPLSGQMGEALAEWVRNIGVEKGVAPNHGWRHRFKTVAYLVGMDPRTRDVIQGHAPRTVGEKYGVVPLDTMWKELLRLPRYDVAPPTGPRPVTEAVKEASRKRMATAKRAKARKRAAAQKQAAEAHAD